MKAFIPYLNFQGNTREAMTFYQQCLGAELDIRTFGEMNAPFPGHEHHVMHARLSKGEAVLMASDPMPGSPVIVGNNVWVVQDCESVNEIETLFVALGAGGRVIMPLADQSWGAQFGMLADKFGINWMFNYTLPTA